MVVLVARWVTFCAPRAIIVVMVLAEDLRNALARDWANARGFLIHHGRLLLSALLRLHIVVKGATNRVPSAYHACTVGQSLALLLHWLEVAHAAMEPLVAIIMRVAWLLHERGSREVVNAHIVVIFNPVTAKRGWVTN